MRRRLVSEDGASWGGRPIAQAAAGLARLGWREPEAMAVLAARAIELLPPAAPSPQRRRPAARDAAMLGWAFGTLHIQHPALIAKGNAAIRAGMGGEEEGGARGMCGL